MKTWNVQTISLVNTSGICTGSAQKAISSKRESFPMHGQTGPVSGAVWCTFETHPIFSSLSPTFLFPVFISHASLNFYPFYPHIHK